MINATHNKTTRAGRYVRQPAGYRAFIPAPLPPDPPLALSGSLQEALSAADCALGRLDGAVLTLPNPDLFVFMYVRKEAVLSSRIEGTGSSLQNLPAAEAQLFDPEMPKDVQEVANYVRALNHGLARPAELPLSVRLIREIHAVLMAGLRGGRLTPGELRTSQNWIGPTGATPSTATFVPPAVAQSVAGTRVPRKIPPQRLRSAATHPGGPGQCPVRDHPPFPRRQRPRRATFDHLSPHRKTPPQEARAVPLAYFRRHRAGYYDRPQAMRDAGEWEGWLEFFVRGVAEVSAGATATAAAIPRMREDYRDRITEHLGRAAANGHRGMDHLFDHLIITMATVRDWLGITPVGANQIVNRLEAIGLLREITGHARNRRLRFEPYLELFEEPEEAQP